MSEPAVVIQESAALDHLNPRTNVPSTRLRETYLISLAFLPTEDPTAPEVALLFQDKDGHRQLISYGIDFDKEDFINTSTMPKLNFMDEEVSTIITIPNTNQAPGGVLVWGGSEILFEQRGPSSSNGKRPRIVPNRQPDARLPWPGSEITGSGCTHCWRMKANFCPQLWICR